MPAYVIATVDVRDAAGYEEYRRQVPETIARYGGRYLARGGRTECLEGDTTGGRVVVLEFASFEQAKRWYDSQEYQAIAPIRHANADATIVIVEGHKP